MKKLFFVLAASALMMLASTTAKAQLYFGGSIGFTTSSMKTEGNTTSGVSFKLAPEVGYQFNDRMAAGGTISFQRGLATLGSFDMNDLKGLITAAAGTETDLGNTPNNGANRFNVFRMAPYFRFHIIETRRFNLFVDGVVAYSSVTQQNKANNAWTDANKFGMFEVGARPGFMLKFDGGHFAVIGHLGNLGFQSVSRTNGASASISRFGLDVDANNLSLGFIYML